MEELKREATENDVIEFFIRNNVYVDIFLSNGIRMEGYIMGHDGNTITIRKGISSITQLIYKNQVTTVQESYVRRSDASK